ncbi:hypothetical protein O2N63_11000 [Aliiroseovarius sp. KMU-50]|uniref:AsmA-like C-terminal domain-containing protein n=1 Tax=Aliiroseovarius salicola TaxID=3009082 RepID=A0ABT4W2A5_9RHOB|nr:AsmA-like C-terminal region-containing protein [Aliiroseovarius sp. KMU-50]MDA5094611.1 hypothetical protein [Aliiroseovarius sp. KMU-50]
MDEDPHQLDRQSLPPELPDGEGPTGKDSIGTATAAARVVPGPDGPMCPIAARKARRRRRLKWHLSIWSVMLILLGGLFLVMLSMSLTGRVVGIPDWVTTRIETVINAQTDRADLSLHRVELGISPKGIPNLRFVDVGVKDQTGLEVARLNAVEGGVRIGDVLRGDIKPAWLRLSGAQVTLRRRANGDFDLSFGTSGGASGDLASILDVIDSEFTDGTLADLEEISTEALTITLEDARSGRLWQVTDGQMTLTHNEEAVDITVSFDVFNQTEVLAETVLGFRAFKGRSGATMTATFKNALARDIAAQSPVMAFLGVVDAPISGALHTVISDAGLIQDMAGTLEFGEGAVTPGAGVAPIRFDGGKVYMDYDPERERIDFAEVSILTDWGEAQVEGHSYLRGWEQGWPAELIGQLSLTSARITPPDMFEAPLELTGGGADFRLRLSPFTLELGAVNLSQGAGHVTGYGRAIARSNGWDLALDLSADKVTKEQVLAFWPLTEKGAKSRKWTKTKLYEGHLENVTAALRVLPGEDPKISLSSNLVGMRAEVVKGMIPVRNVSGRFSIEQNQMIVSADSGFVRPEGQAPIDVSGTRFVILDMKTKPSPARVDLSLRGQVPAALALLAEPPYRIFRKSGRIGADIVDKGQFELSGQIDLRLMKKIPKEELRFNLLADVWNGESTKLIEGKTLRLSSGKLHVRHDGLELTGQGGLGQMPLSATWNLPLGVKANGGKSTVSGRAVLDQRLLDELSIDLPKGSVSGESQAQFDMTITPGEPTTLVAQSDLSGLAMSFNPLGWAKPANRKGSLEIEAVLGKPVHVPKITLTAAGLSAVGQIRLHEQGGLDIAQFGSVQLAGWLDAPVTLTGRGEGLPPAISVNGGTVDMRNATLGSGKGGSVPGAVPIDLVLDRLIVSSGITLTQFDGKFQQHNGTKGTFQARVGGGAGITGAVAPQANGMAIRIKSDDAGGVMRDAGVFKNAYGGDLELVLAPGGSKGTYEGELKVGDVSVRDAPAMAELLSAVSVVGLLQQLGGQGIPFGEVTARFRLDPEKVTIYRSSAVGHSLGVSMDGYYHLGSSEMEMQGVISPFYIVNSAGRALARKGEGLIGFNYTLSGTPENPDVGVNPLSLFTPGIFRDIFRRKPPPKPQ